MTGKIAKTDGEGPGVRAQRVLKRRWLVFQGVYAVVATALVIGLMMGRRDPADGFPPFTPEAGVAGAVLLPLLTLVTMWFALRMVDELPATLGLYDVTMQRARTPGECPPSIRTVILPAAA